MLVNASSSSSSLDQSTASMRSVSARKRRRTDGGKEGGSQRGSAETGTSTAAAASSAASASASASSTTSPQADVQWSAMYAPLPEAIQPQPSPASASSPLASAAAAASASSSANAAFVPALLSTLIPHPHAVELNYQTKLKDKHLMLENTTAIKSGANLGDSTARLNKNRRRKRGIQMMSSNERKRRGLDTINKKELKYSMFVPLHQLWLQYMHDILDPQHARGLSTAERVLKADWHGAILTVVSSRSPTLVGHRGILIRESQEAFQIITDTNAVKLIPKRQSVFSISLPPPPSISSSPSSSSASSVSPSPSPSLPQVFELFGDQLCFRSYERSSRKFKAKATIQL